MIGRRDGSGVEPSLPQVYEFFMLIFSKTLECGHLRKHPPEPMPPEPHRPVADVDVGLIRQVFDVTQRQRLADVWHHGQADDLWARLEAAERGAFGHRVRPV
jgi:hypothetical protein